jgi:ABC-type antimicrobial peptide transport system permease subunit
VGSALFAAFGGAALLIAAIGVYGVHAYAVSRRTREIGIRMSLGARPADIFQLIMSLGVKQTAIALALGAVLALGAGQMIGSLLYRVSPYDPLALGGAIFVLGAAALLACYFPARRATRVNPITALRME